MKLTGMELACAIPVTVELIPIVLEAMELVLMLAIGPPAPIESPVEPGECRLSPVPAASILDGKHCTLTCPFASRLSTQLGNAPVSMYWSYMVFERLWYQSVRSTGVAVLSAWKRALSWLSLAARLWNGRRRDGEGRIRSGPRMASL